MGVLASQADSCLAYKVCCASRVCARDAWLEQLS
jgi:hypothetical protein